MTCDFFDSDTNEHVDEPGWMCSDGSMCVGGFDFTPGVMKGTMCDPCQAPNGASCKYDFTCEFFEAATDPYGREGWKCTDGRKCVNWFDNTGSLCDPCWAPNFEKNSSPVCDAEAEDRYNAASPSPVTIKADTTDDGGDDGGDASGDDSGDDLVEIAIADEDAIVCDHTNNWCANTSTHTHKPEPQLIRV